MSNDAGSPISPQTSRRALLTGAVAAGAGFAVGQLGQSNVVQSFVAPAVPKPRSAQRRTVEAQGKAARGPEDFRPGSRRITWSVETPQPFASVTFDDGPDPAFTPRVLDALRAAELKATFMVMGWNAVNYPELLKEVIAEGHEIGNHSWSHEDLAFQTAEQTREEIVKAKEAIEDIVQVPLVGYRPPRGVLNGAAMMICAELGYDVWMWSVTRGPSDPGVPAEVADWVGSHTKPGDILDLHDSIGWHVRDRTTAYAEMLIARREVEIQALPRVLSMIKDRGITLVPMTTLAASTGSQ